MYACELVDEKTKMTAKGVKRSFVKNKLRFENYRQALFANTKADMQQQATFSAIRSFDHQVATVEITKSRLAALGHEQEEKMGGAHFDEWSCPSVASLLLGSMSAERPG